MTEPPLLTHVFVGKTLKRLDEINLEEAREVIRRLCDELDELRRKRKRRAI